MAFCTDTHFVLLTRDIWIDEYKHLSLYAKWLLICLNEAEQRVFENDSSKVSKKFYYTDKQLCELTGLSQSTITRAKRELRLYATALIYIESPEPTKDNLTGKKIFPPTYYRLLR